MQLISIKCTFNDPPRDPLHIQAYIYTLRLGRLDISWEYCERTLQSEADAKATKKLRKRAKRTKQSKRAVRVPDGLDRRSNNYL